MDARIQAILKRTRGPSVLDVGCLDGLQCEPPKHESTDWLHGHLVANFQDVWGIDLSASRVAEIRRVGYENVFAVSAEEFSFEKRFTTIVAGELIEHLPNPARFLARARDHLEPDGRIVLTTPYVFGLEHQLYAAVKYPKTCQNAEHTAWFCPSTISTLARLAGLSVLSIDLLRDDRRASGWGPYALALRAQRLANVLLPARITAKTMIVELA